MYYFFIYIVLATGNIVFTCKNLNVSIKFNAFPIPEYVILKLVYYYVIHIKILLI